MSVTWGAVPRGSLRLMDECPVGWEKLVAPLVYLCALGGGTVDQIKEKFGELRFYYTKPPSPTDERFWEHFDSLVMHTCYLSRYVCQLTGERGKLRTHKLDGSFAWIATLSDKEAKRLGYK